jgi:hypothetical protein
VNGEGLLTNILKDSEGTPFEDKNKNRHYGTVTKGFVFNMNYIIEQPLIHAESPKHSVLIHPTPFISQPTGQLMGKVTNELKKIGFSKRYSIQEILEYFSKGHSIILADVETESVKSHFNFISASIFAIDVDDTEKITDPVAMLHQLKHEAVGLFYTFNHGIKGNRYRLVFQLSRSVKDERLLKSIIELKAKELLFRGIPVDIQAKNPTFPVRGGRKGYLVNNLNNTLDVDNLLRLVEKENIKRQSELYQEYSKPLRPLPFSTLKEMAESIGYIPTGSGQGELWKRLVIGIKHCANTGIITQDEGFELFDIISGGEQSQRAWESLKASGHATIGSLVHEAKKWGYKGKYNYFEEVEAQENFEKEIIKVKQYIPTEVAQAVLLSGKRTLVNSPTGSGKTTAFISAFKRLENANNDIFYIFSTPTIALTTQIANKHKIMAIKGQTKDLFKQINSQIWNGGRVFISTYDMTPNLMEFITIILRKYNRQPKFYLVVDELHKFVTDYDISYRYRAIQNLYKVSKEVNTFVGLSGTVDDIYKGDFDKVINIDNGKPQSPCLEVASYIYEKKDNALPELAKLIEIWTKKRRLLIYIQSKKKIDQLQNLLRRQGIKVRTISADRKINLTYKQLIENETIDTEVQVVLTTSVIADGVNINNDLEWEVIVVCNEFSKLFNPSSIKQISNRLRNPYRRFSIFMQQPRQEEKSMFQIEGAFSFHKKIADMIIKELNEHPYFDQRLFRKSVIEKRYGIYLENDGGLGADILFLRHSASIDQERYYMSFRHAFIRAIKKVFHYKSEIAELNISKEIRKKNLNTVFEQQFLDEIKEKQEEHERLKGKSIGKVFTREVYMAFREDDEKTLVTFKKLVQERQYACLKAITPIAEYETCMKVVSKVKRNADTYFAFTDINSLVDVTYQQAIDRPSKTKKVLERLLALDEFIENQEMEQELEKIAKSERLAKADVKKVCQLVQFESKKGAKGVRFKRVSGCITVQTIATKHGLTESEVVHIAKEYSKRKNPLVQKVIEVKLEISLKSENLNLFQQG